MSGSRHARKRSSGEQWLTIQDQNHPCPGRLFNCSREGLRYAIAFANEFGAKIILLHATYLGYVYSSEGTAIYDIPGLQKAARKTAERKMRELVRSVNFGPVKFKTAFTDGSPVIDICAFAKDHDVDLIITSTHGFTGFTHVLIGSEASKWYDMHLAPFW